MNKFNIAVIAASLLISSCSTSNDVVSGNFIQKRKYTKGFYVSKKSHVKTLAKHVPITTSNAVIETENATENLIVLIDDSYMDTESITDIAVVEERIVKKQKFKQENQIYSLSIPEDVPSPKDEGLGIAGMITSLVGLFVFGILFGLVAIIFGSISLSKIAKNPEKFKGKGYGITAIIVGIIDVLFFIILIALLLAV